MHFVCIARYGYTRSRTITALVFGVLMFVNGGVLCFGHAAYGALYGLGTGLHGVDLKLVSIA